MAKCLRPITVRKSAHSTSFIQVPCGRCINCRKRRQRDWVFRLKMEQRNYPRGSFFITLTYAPEYVPTTKKGNQTLRKRDVQLFIKRVRKQLSSCGSSMRYYLCGEYGDKFHRPHYHALVFISDTENWLHTDGVNDIGQVLNKICIQKNWHYGYTKTSFFTDARAGYVAKYSVKKLGCDYVTDDDDYVMPFSLQSTKPAIGLCFTKSREASDMVENSNFIYHSYDGSVYYLPRYLREKMFSDNARAWNSFLIRYRIEIDNEIERRLHPHFDTVYWYNKINNDLNTEYQLMRDIDPNKTLVEFYKELKNE